MTWHLAAYTALNGNVANTDTPALADGIIPITNNHFIPNTPTNLLWAAVTSATQIRGRLNFPKARQISPRYILPANVGTLFGANPNIMPLMDQPFGLNAQEEIALEDTANPATTEQVTGLIAIGDRITPPPAGDLYVARFSSTTTVVANKWSLLTAIYEQNFLAGTYVVTWAQIASTNMQAYRVIFDQQFFRPGMVGSALMTNRLPYQFSTRDLGVWGTFRTVTLPRFEVLCNGADAAFEGLLEMIRIGP
jgi:hypothetical protein